MIRLFCILMLWAGLAHAEDLPDYMTLGDDPLFAVDYEPDMTTFIRKCLSREFDNGPQNCQFVTTENPCFKQPDLGFEDYSQCFLVEANSWDRVMRANYRTALRTAREHDAYGASARTYASAEATLVAAQELFMSYRNLTCRGQWVSQAAPDNGPDRAYALCMVRITALRAHQLHAWGQI